MSKLLLLTDSNYINNSRKYLGPKIKSLEVVSCQNKSVLMSELAGVREGIVVIACLDLIASEAAKSCIGAQDSAVELAFNHILWKVMDLLEEAEGGLACGIVAPVFWKEHSALTTEGIHHAYMLAQKVPVPNLWLTEYVSGMIVGRDRVHLVPQAGRKYVEIVNELFKKIDRERGSGLVEFESPDLTLVPEGSNEMSWEADDGDAQGFELIPPVSRISPNRTLSNVSASMLRSVSAGTGRAQPRLDFRHATGSNAIPVGVGSGATSRIHNPGVRFSIPPPSLPNQAQLDAPQQLVSSARAPVSWPTMLTPELSASLAKIELRLGDLESKSIQDNIMMASLKEEQDSEANKAMLDRLTVIGIRIPNIRRMKDEERNPAMKNKMEEFLAQIKDDESVIEILFIRHINRQARNPESTVLEVRFKSEEQANKVRSWFIKKRDSPRVEGINIMPTVRLATRVRVEILQAVARLTKQEDSSVSKTQCLQFLSKPILKIFRKDRSGNEFPVTKTFIDCVVWVLENDLGKKIDLKWAYKRAGASFRGTMTQHFVIMS